MKVVVTGTTAEEVVREAFWLAWQACGGTASMGFLQNNPDATKDVVWDAIRISHDYSVGIGLPAKEPKPGEAYGDYVFGRMMKLRIKWDGQQIEVRDDAPQRDYQAWCRKYPTYSTLLNAAIESLGALSTVIA